MKSLLKLVGIALGAGAVVGGCVRSNDQPAPPPPAAQPAPQVIVQPPPQIIVEQGPVVYTEPPQPQVEVVTVAPGPEFVWTDGDWAFEVGAWHWHPGHWDRPPHPDAHWERGHWDHEGNGYRHRDGHWR